MFLDALNQKNHNSRPPVWLMRQAGRCLPCYRELRQHHTLLELFHTPELVADVTSMPVELLGVDAAILFTDILIVFDGLGVRWDVVPGRGPIVQQVSRAEQLSRDWDPTVFDFLWEGIRLIRQRLQVPLIGFCGAPFTLACYLIEGGSSRDFKRVKQLVYRDPEAFRDLLESLTLFLIPFLKRQVEMGVQAIQVFESWGHLLPLHVYAQLVLPSIEKITEAIRDVAPVILFSRGSASLAPLLSSVGPHALSLDWGCDLAHMRNQLPRTCALQGNLDPTVLLADPAKIREATTRLLEQMEGDPGYIFNLGHGVLPETPMEAVQTVVNCVKEYACLLPV